MERNLKFEETCTYTEGFVHVIVIMVVFLLSQVNICISIATFTSPCKGKWCFTLQCNTIYSVYACRSKKDWLLQNCPPFNL